MKSTRGWDQSFSSGVRWAFRTSPRTHAYPLWRAHIRTLGRLRPWNLHPSGADPAPQPALALLSVVLVALLDSNLKHDTQLLADAIVGAKVDSFPAEFPHWTWARRLNAFFLGILLLYQGGIHRWGKTAVRVFFYPQQGLTLLNRPILCISAIMPLVLVINFFFPKVPFLRSGLLAWEGSGSHLFVSPRTQVLAAIMGIGLWVITYWVLVALNALFRFVKPSSSGTSVYAFNGSCLILGMLPMLLVTPWLRHIMGRVWSKPEFGWASATAIAIGIGIGIYALIWCVEWLVRSCPRSVSTRK